MATIKVASITIFFVGKIKHSLLFRVQPKASETYWDKKRNEIICVRIFG